MLDEVRKEFAQAGQIGGATPFVRNRGTGEFVHMLGSEWPFMKDMAGKGDDGVPEMYEELRHMLPLRYENADSDGQRQKIEWMRQYVNKTIAEQNLLNGWKVVLPSR